MSYINAEFKYRANRIATLKNLRTKRGQTEFGGVIFRKSDREDIAGIEDLRGKVFAAVHPNSFGGWYMAWREIKNFGLDPAKDFKRLDFLGEHFAVVESVRRDEADVGTVRSNTLEFMANEGLISLDDFVVLNPSAR